MDKEAKKGNSNRENKLSSIWYTSGLVQQVLAICVAVRTLFRWPCDHESRAHVVNKIAGRLRVNVEVNG